MMAGFIGIGLAFLFLVLVVVFGKRKRDPAIKNPLNNLLPSQGFSPIDPFDPILKPVTQAFKSTAYAVYVEQAFKKGTAQELFCWLHTQARHSQHPDNNLIATIPNSANNGEWVFLFLPGISGFGGNLIHKSFELSLLSSGFSKIETPALGPLSKQASLYVLGNASGPLLKEELIQKLPQCGNIVLRSGGSMVLIERIDLTRSETRENEAKELLRISHLLAGSF